MVKHGDFKMYRRIGCRCDMCRQAHRIAQRRARAQAAMHPERMPSGAHGTENGYNYWKCRCDLCRAAMSEYRANLKAAKREPRS